MNEPGDCYSHRIKEFYTSYAATLMNLASPSETTKHGQKDSVATLDPLDSVIFRDKSNDILESSINRILHGTDYMAPLSVWLFERKHHEVINTTNKEVNDSREWVLRWISKQIGIHREHARLVTTILITISKATLNFPTKVWWVLSMHNCDQPQMRTHFSHSLLHL